MNLFSFEIENEKFMNAVFVLMYSWYSRDQVVWNGMVRRKSSYIFIYILSNRRTMSSFYFLF